MARLNLICNGMMLFNEIEDHIQIVIPDIPGHVRRLCSDPRPAKNNLTALDVGRYQLNAPMSNRASLRELFDTRGYLVLRKGIVVFDETAAIPVSALITVPKPTLIRLFRACEPTINFLGSTSTAVIYASPNVLHDVVVFSYKDIPEGINLRLASSSSDLASATTTANQTINWIIYSNEEKPLESLDDRHPTTLNDFLSVNQRKTDLTLSGLGVKDGPCQTGIGMAPYHMTLYEELPENTGGVVKVEVSGRPGCSGGCLAY